MHFKGQKRTISMQEQLYLVAQAADEEERYCAHAMKPYHRSLARFVGPYGPVGPARHTAVRMPIGELRYSASQIPSTISRFTVWEIILCILEGTMRIHDLPKPRIVRLPEACEIRSRIESALRSDFKDDFLALDGGLVALDNAVLYVLKKVCEPQDHVMVSMEDSSHLPTAFAYLASPPHVTDGTTCRVRLECCSQRFSSEMDVLMHVLLQHSSRAAEVSPLLKYLPEGRSHFLSTDFAPGTILHTLLQCVFTKSGEDLRNSVRRVTLDEKYQTSPLYDREALWKKGPPTGLLKDGMASHV